ncbi:MAG: thioesterase family protein [Hyphomonadaceae bacterium]
MADAGDFTEPFFTLDGNVAHPSRFTHGPWDVNAQHGGAPTALLAWWADRLPAPAPMHLSRLTVDLMRPVPIAPLEIRTEIVREGRQIQLAQLSLYADGKEVTRATALRIRKLAVDTPLIVRPPAQRWKQPEESQRLDGFAPAGLANSLDIRLADGRFRDKNAPPIWFKVNRPFIGGEETSPIIRAAITADFCNGMSGALEWEKWTFINADLTIHFARPPEGEWMMLEATGWVSDDGRGTAFGALSDQKGAFGRATQSLVIAPR